MHGSVLRLEILRGGEFGSRSGLGLIGRLERDGFFHLQASISGANVCEAVEQIVPLSFLVVLDLQVLWEQQTLIWSDLTSVCLGFTSWGRAPCI